MKFIGLTLPNGQALRIDAYSITYYGESESAPGRCVVGILSRDGNKQFEVMEPISEIDHVITIAAESRY